MSFYESILIASALLVVAYVLIVVSYIFRCVTNTERQVIQMAMTVQEAIAKLQANTTALVAVVAGLDKIGEETKKLQQMIEDLQNDDSVPYSLAEQIEAIGVQAGVVADKVKVVDDLVPDPEPVPELAPTPTTPGPAAPVSPAEAPPSS